MLSHRQIERIKEDAFSGNSSLLPNVCRVTPLTMGEILKLGMDSYNSKLGILLLTEVDIVKIIKEKTGQEIPIESIEPLSYLLQSAEHDDMFLLELQSAFATFIKEDIMLLPKINSVLVGAPQDRRLITSQNYSDFQDILRLHNKREMKEPPPENESAIARKFRLKREARDAAKRKQQEKNGDGQSLVDLLEIATVFGIDYKNVTIFAFYNLIARYQAKEKWDQDIKLICAGADSKKIKSKYWGESLKEK